MKQSSTVLQIYFVQHVTMKSIRPSRTFRTMRNANRSHDKRNTKSFTANSVIVVVVDDALENKPNSAAITLVKTAVCIPNQATKIQNTYLLKKYTMLLVIKQHAYAEKRREKTIISKDY